MTLVMTFELTKLYLILDAILYTTLVFTALFSFVWFILWITGIQYLVFWLFKQDVYLIGYLILFILIIFVVGSIFVHLLEYMDANLLVIKKDRLFLLQQNMDLWKENNDIKRILTKMMNNLSEDDKKIIDSN
jgi:hypothetical protein